MDKCDDIYIAFATAPTLTEARMISKTLVSQRIAVCCKLHKVDVNFNWKGQMKDTEEYQLTIVVKEPMLEGLEKAIMQLTSYDSPELLVVPASFGKTEYLKWARE